MKFHNSLMLACCLAIVGIVFGIELASPQDSRTADSSHDLINKINLGLFNWNQDSNGIMVASFVMSNYGDRDIRELTISCDYTGNFANSPKKIERTLKDGDLATRLAGEFLMRAHTGRHYIDINFGPIDPANSVRYMACRVSNVKF
jgi:hypothetical protein